MDGLRGHYIVSSDAFTDGRLQTSRITSDVNQMVRYHRLGAQSVE